jgi:DNA-binding XRE family transcriptional regulator
VNNRTTKQTIDRIYQLGRKISEYRNKQKYTQESFSEIIDISREHLAKIETAKRSVSLDLLIKIADALNIKVKDLFDF